MQSKIIVQGQFGDVMNENIESVWLCHSKRLTFCTKFVIIIYKVIIGGSYGNQEL
jgi:hypothetical protein